MASLPNWAVFSISSIGRVTNLCWSFLIWDHFESAFGIWSGTTMVMIVLAGLLSVLQQFSVSNQGIPKQSGLIAALQALYSFTLHWKISLHLWLLVTICTWTILPSGLKCFTAVWASTLEFPRQSGLVAALQVLTAPLYTGKVVVKGRDFTGFAVTPTILDVSKFIL